MGDRIYGFIKSCGLTAAWSCSCLETPKRCATFSEVTPIGSKQFCACSNFFTCNYTIHYIMRCQDVFQKKTLYNALQTSQKPVKESGEEMNKRQYRWVDWPFPCDRISSHRLQSSPNTCIRHHHQLRSSHQINVIKDGYPLTNIIKSSFDGGSYVSNSLKPRRALPIHGSNGNGFCQST